MVIVNMKPPQNLVQGKPSYKLNSGKYKPSLGFDGSGETPAGTQLVNKLSNKTLNVSCLSVALGKIETNQLNWLGTKERGRIS